MQNKEDIVKKRQYKNKYYGKRVAKQCKDITWFDLY